MQEMNGACRRVHHWESTVLGTVVGVAEDGLSRFPVFAIVETSPQIDNVWCGISAMESSHHESQNSAVGGRHESRDAVKTMWKARVELMKQIYDHKARDTIKTMWKACFELMKHIYGYLRTLRMIQREYRGSRARATTSL